MIFYVVKLSDKEKWDLVLFMPFHMISIERKRAEFELSVEILRLYKLVFH